MKTVQFIWLDPPGLSAQKNPWSSPTHNDPCRIPFPGVSGYAGMPPFFRENAP